MCACKRLDGKRPRPGLQDVLGIVLRGDIKKTVVEVIRVNDRLMAIRVQLKERMVFIISCHAPQSGCDDGVREQFRADLQSLTERTSPGEVLVILGDLNAHVGSTGTGYEDRIGIDLARTDVTTEERICWICVW